MTDGFSLLVIMIKLIKKAQYVDIITENTLNAANTQMFKFVLFYNKRITVRCFSRTHELTSRLCIR